MRTHRLASIIAVAALGAAAVPAVASTVSSTPSVVWDALPSSYGITTHGSLSTFTRTGVSNLDKATSQGKTPASTLMTVDLVIEHPHYTQEHDFAESIYDETSANYHHYLTPATYAARFGVPTSASKAAGNWLSKGGLKVISTSGSGDIVQAEGPVAKVEKLFSTSISSFRSDGLSYLANTVAPVVPTALHVTQVIGLNTKQKATVNSQTDNPKPAVAGLTSDGPFDPNTMAKIYDQPATNTGQGQTAGVFISGQMAPIISDLRVYEGTYKLGTHPVRTVYEGKGVTTTNYGGDEWNLDTSAIVGMAPGIKEMDYYDAFSLYDVDLLPDFALWRDDANGPKQMDASFGECEQNPGYPVLGAAPVSTLFFNGLGNNTEPAYEMVLQAAAMEGRTLFSSAGDTGGACPGVLLPGLGAVNGAENAGIPLQNYPAASPWGASVGGTDIEATDPTLSTRTLEYAEPTSGGGPSVFLAAQPWQVTTFADTARSPQAVPDPCVVDELGNAYPVGTECRGVPDVAALYGGQTGEGYESEEYHTTEAVGGTSLSSPLNVGMWTRQQAAAPTAAGWGFAPPTLYKAFNGANGAGDFYDVTVGTNGQRTAGPGYDYVTGMGVPDGAKLMMDLAGKLTPTFNPKVAAVPTQTADACVPVFSTFSGNASDPLNATGAVPGAAPLQDAALDITSGDIKSSSDGKNLIVTLKGATLSPSLDTQILPFGADFDVAWVFKGKVYKARATVQANTGLVSFEAGEQGFAPIGGTTTGAVPNPTDDLSPVTGTFGEGTLTMIVPVSMVGSPKTGDRLAFPMGYDETPELGPAFGSLVVDAGADQDYVLGSTCTGSSQTVAGKQLTINRSAVAVRYGQKITLSGRLSLAGVPTPGVTLTLKGRTDDKKTVVLHKVKTDKDGRWTYTFKPSRDEVYSITGGNLTAKLAKTPTTLSFPQLRGTASNGVLSVSGSVSPGYKLGGKVHETVYVYELNKKLKPIKLLGKVSASQLSSRKGSPLGVNRFSLVTGVPHGNYLVGISVSSMPLNTGAIAARFRVRV